jgi:hypothetical protein
MWYPVSSGIQQCNPVSSKILGTGYKKIPDYLAEYQASRISGASLVINLRKFSPIPIQGIGKFSYFFRFLIFLILTYWYFVIIFEKITPDHILKSALVLLYSRLRSRNLSSCY